MSQTQNSEACECVCTPPRPSITLPLTGVELSFDASALDCHKGIEPGPEGTHLVSRNGALVWERLPACGVQLAQDLDLFVAPDGDDANDGLSAATSLKTIAAALEKTTAYARSVYTITINLASGSYPEFVNVDFTGHYPKLVIKGNDSLPVIENGVYAEMHGRLTLDQVYVKQNTATRVVWGSRHAVVHLNDCHFAAGSGTDKYVISGNVGATILISGKLSVTSSGTVLCIFSASQNSFMLLDPSAVINVSGAATSGTFASMSGSRICVYNGATISGSVTGKRYGITGASSIVVPGGSATFFPGTIAGTVAAGSVYAAI